MGANDPLGGTIFDPWGTVGKIYKEDHYTLLHTKYESTGPCAFGEEDFFYVFPIVSLWELSVAMETRVLIRPGPKPNATFPHPNDASDKIDHDWTCCLRDIQD